MRKHKEIKGLDAQGCDDIVACDSNDREWREGWERAYPSGGFDFVPPIVPAQDARPVVGRETGRGVEIDKLPLAGQPVVVKRDRTVALIDAIGHALANLTLGVFAIAIASAIFGL